MSISRMLVCLLNTAPLTTTPQEKIVSQFAKKLTHSRALRALTREPFIDELLHASPAGEKVKWQILEQVGFDVFRDLFRVLEELALEIPTVRIGLQLGEVRENTI